MDNMNQIVVSEQARQLAARPYTIVVQRELADDGHVFYFGYHAEMPYCKTEADTPGEVRRLLDEVREEWVQCLLDNRLPIPSPHNKTRMVITIESGGF